MVLRQAVGDYNTIINSTNDFKILAWFLWFFIFIIGNLIFMNFIIAVVSDTYENCLDKSVQLIYDVKL